MQLIGNALVMPLLKQKDILTNIMMTNTMMKIDSCGFLGALCKWTENARKG